jgi:hypothetical protein
MQYSNEEKLQHLEHWRKSGLSQSAYCRENNLKLATFHYWKIQADKAVNSTVAPFIPATVNSPSGILSVNTPSGLSMLRWDKHGVWLAVRRLHRGLLLTEYIGANFLCQNQSRIAPALICFLF